MTFSLSTVHTAHGHRPKRASIGTYLTVWKQRRELASLSVSRLSDLGITPAQAAVEAARPLWDLPCAH